MKFRCSGVNVFTMGSNPLILILGIAGKPRKDSYRCPQSTLIDEARIVIAQVLYAFLRVGMGGIAQSGRVMLKEGKKVYRLG
jgi:hypothetical protein